MQDKKKPEEKRRVLVVDDHPLLRQGVVELLNRQSDLTVCAEADSVHSADMAVERHKPDLVLLDLRLGSGDSLELIKSLRGRYENLRVLVISQHDETIFAERCLRAGADGYITKQEASEEVLTAIRTVLAGEPYMSRKVAVLVFRQSLERPSKESVNIASLSDRELHVFQLLGSGMSTREIAADSKLSVKTIESHRENIKHKLGLRDSVELVERAKTWVNGLPPRHNN
jgi:DNA-binding NarL/FixJ family response regulator